MNDILFNILQVVIIACVIIVTRYVAPALKSYIDTSKYAWMASVVTDAVEMAEQTIKTPKSGAEKKAVVLGAVSTIFAKAKISITEDQINSLIESAVYAMNFDKAH